MVCEDSIYDFSAPLLDGSPLSLARFRHMVLLVVNTASQCGSTPQYAGLEQLYSAYRDRGFIVLAFPCNQFGAQEPGTADQIGDFCQKIYGVSFPVFAKIDVNGPNTHPLYHFLKAHKGGFLGLRRISWNFTKFLINTNGNVAKRYGPSKQPKDLASTIERLLMDL